MTTIVLIRPGSTDFDDQRRIQGSLDLPLNPRGRQQVQTIVDRLGNVPLEMIYAAPSDPARSTAEAIGESLGVPVKEAQGLRNLNQGLWEGMELEAIRRKFPKVFKQWEDSPESICPPEGETVTQAVERIRTAMHKPLKRKATFAVVASEPLASLIRCVIKGAKPETPGPICGGPDGQLLEFLETNGKPNGANAGATTSETVAAASRHPRGGPADELGAET